MMKPFETMLESASAGWVQEGLITDTQRAAILQRHPLAGSAGTSRFVGIVATIGGVLFAVGVSLVIKANWEALGDWVKIGGLVALLLTSYVVGWRLKVVQGHFEKTGEACLMIGQILFLCGIALVSQIFHLNSRPANGVLLWWLGIALVPWLTRAKGAQFVSIVAALVWFGIEMTTRGSLIDVRGGPGDYSSGIVNSQAVFVLLGISLWGFGLTLRQTRWADFAGMHEMLGILVTGTALFLLSFARHVWDWHHKFAGFTPSVALAVGVAAVLAVLAFAAASRGNRSEVKALAPWLGATLVPLAGVLAVGPVGDGGWLWSGLAFVSLFALSVAIVRVGLETGREGWVNLGVLFIAANIIARYFDLFGTLLEGGVFFIVTGVLITGLGIFLEKKRRALLAALRKEVSS